MTCSGLGKMTVQNQPTVPRMATAPTACHTRLFIRELYPQSSNAGRRLEYDRAKASHGYLQQNNIRPGLELWVAVPNHRSSARMALPIPSHRSSHGLCETGRF